MTERLFYRENYPRVLSVLPVMRSSTTSRYVLPLMLLAITLAIIVAWETTTNNGQYHMKDNDEKVNESLELRAIKELHSHLDDNKDGQVDYNESTDFVHDELHHLTSDDRSHTFFSDDRTISYKELWKKWKESKVHNWTCEDVIEWLVGVVELPELVSQFKSIGINGKHLPLIAANIDHFLKKLDAKGHQRRKLQLKAMDVVLFGPLPVPHSYWKDAIMSLSVLISLIGLGYFWRQHWSAKKKIDKFLKEIKVYESEMKFLKEKLKQKSEEEKEEMETTDGAKSCNSDEAMSSPNERLVDMTPSTLVDDVQRTRSLSYDAEAGSSIDRDENRNLRMRIWELESQLESLSANKLALKEVLKETCRCEWFYLDSSKRLAEDEVLSAQKMCEKIKKKRSSFIGAFSLANSSTLEDAGLLITKAVNKMQKVTSSFEEYNRRWKSVEDLCGFSILSSTYSSTHMLTVESSRTNSVRRRYQNSSSVTLHEEQVTSYISSLYKGTPTGQDTNGSFLFNGIDDYENEEDIKVRDLPSWNSAPGGLHQKSDYSEPSRHGDEGSGSDRNNFYLKDSFDSLGIIEEEGSRCNGNGLPHNKPGGAAGGDDSQSECSSSSSENVLKSRLRSVTRKSKSLINNKSKF